jgi:hypothetical protein
MTESWEPGESVPWPAGMTHSLSFPIKVACRDWICQLIYLLRCAILANKIAFLVRLTVLLAQRRSAPATER